MNGRRVWILTMVLGLAGCCGPEQRASLFPSRPCDRCGQNNVPPDVRLAPFPPGPVPAPPSGATVIPAPQPAQLPPYSPPPMVGDTGPVGRLDGPSKYIPEPAVAQVRLDVPIPLYSNAKPVTPPPPSDLAARTGPKETTEPPPVDIPGYTLVNARVASGRQPFPDGIAWLQTKGYKTVLHLRAPGDDTSAARRQFEKRGLQYVSLEVAPGLLTKNLAEQFNAIVADETTMPLFVCDRDGALAGSLWYLHFRMKGLPDVTALDKAGQLGFHPDQDADHKALLDAARTMLTAAEKN